MASLSIDELHRLLQANGIDHPIPSLPGLNIDSSPINIFVAFLAQALIDATGCDAPVALNSIQWPNEAGMGDLVVVVPRLKLQETDVEAAVERFSQRTADLLPLFGRPMADGIHQRVFLNAQTLGALSLPFILAQGSAYGTDLGEASPDGSDEVSKKGKVVVEFSSPNLGKEFDGNHLRSTIHGSFIASVHEFLGYEVHRLNFLGDWGKHIGILAEGWLHYGSEAALEECPLPHLLECFTKANELMKVEELQLKAAKNHEVQRDDASPCVNGDGSQPQHEMLDDGTSEAPLAISVSAAKDAFFQKLESGDTGALELWKRFRELCISRYAALYRDMNVDFDEYSGESTASPETISEVESLLKEKGRYTESEDAWIIEFKKLGFKHLGIGIARYRNGTTSYLLRDVAAVLERSRRQPFDKMIYVVASRQETHFLQVAKVLELTGIPQLAAKLHHVGFGKVTGLSPKDGRSGLLLEDILSQYQDAVRNLLDADPQVAADFDGDDAHGMAATALACQALAAGKRSSTVEFAVDSIGSTEGWTGLTLRMWLRRLAAVTQGALDTTENADVDYSLLTAGVYQEPIRLLLEFPHAVRQALKSLESSNLIIYLYRLTDALPPVWDLGEVGSPQSAFAKTAFFMAVKLVLHSGMMALGLETQSEAR